MKEFNPLDFRKNFPLINKKTEANPRINEIVTTPALVYFDNGATTQKPSVVINSYLSYYQNNNANVHRASHQLSTVATQEFEESRLLTQQYINAKHSHEIIWTKGTTESINLVAQSWGLSHLTSGDEIVVSYAEHHANIVPWQLVAQKTGAVINVLPLTKFGTIDEQSLTTVINEKTKIVCVNHMSNVVGKINPIETVIARAKQVGALTLIDGAQAVAHIAIDVQALNCDFYAFSAHKMYGPTGVGVLYGKQALLDKMPPYQSGGEMIKRVSFSGTSFNELPFKFEAGTPNIAGVIAFSRCIQFIQEHTLLALHQYEQQLIHYAYTQLQAIKGLAFIVENAPDIPVFSFRIAGHHNHDIAAALDSFNIAVRSGHHCAMPLMELLAIDGCIRVSMAAYNTFNEIDYLCQCLHNIVDNTQQRSMNFTATVSDANVIQAAFNYSADDIISLFSELSGWDSRHRQIMMLSKALSSDDSNLKTEKNLISGCESNAWLSCQITAHGEYIFYASSDAKVIRGLLVIVLAIYQGKTTEEINNIDIEAYFEKLGLMRHLSPSRGNGVRAIVKRVLLLTQKVTQKINTEN